MARLQDFPTVTPTSSDKILIVQSQGQGLAPHSIKLDSANPTGTGSLSLNRKSGTTTGGYSDALGYNNEASGDFSFSEGGSNASSGAFSHTEGNGNVATGRSSHAEGNGTIANHLCQHAFGQYNTADASTAAVTARGNYIEVVGKGTADNARSNARTLDWSGNETLAGTLTQSSDAKLKDVKDEAIPDVSAIKAIRFTWKKGKGRDFDEHIGYLAQDVEQVLPFLVKKDAEGNKVLDYIAFLVAKIDSLEKRISELEKGE